jgi:[NiFe] hydrogenase diaphorase moiety small subunit
MSRDREHFSFTLDGRRVEAEKGWTITDAAEAAGIWIPRLCHMPGLAPWGSCRVCTVRVNGRPCAACTQPAAPELLVESDTEELRELRRTLVEMLFVDGNHYCMACEKSGRCELQALAYRLGLRAPLLPYLHPHREVDASHPDLLVDHNRCITCGRCVRASRDLDGKAVFGFVGRGTRKTVAVNGTGGLGGSEAELADRAVEACPVGALLPKRKGFDVPVGRRDFDREPIGSRVERGER